MDPIPHIRENQGVHPILQIANEPVEESEDNMSSLVTRFSVRMLKRAAIAQGETTLDSEILGKKRPKWLDLNKEVQKSSLVIISDSPERASDAFPALEGTS